MKIRTIEHSPLPAIRSVQTTRLVFSEADRAALIKAAAILNEADGQLVSRYGQRAVEEQLLDVHMALCLGAGYIEELLEDVRGALLA